MLIFHKGHTDTIHVYSVTVMTHVKALQAGHSSQGSSEPITPVLCDSAIIIIKCLSIYNETRHSICLASILWQKCIYIVCPAMIDKI